MGGTRERDHLLDIDPLMNLAVALTYQMPCRLHKRIRGRGEKEVPLQHFLRFTKLFLRFFEIEIDVECIDEVCYRVTVLIPFLPDYTDKILQQFLVRICASRAASVGDDGGGEISEDPGAVGLDGVDEGGGEIEVGEEVAGWFVVEEGEERPVDQPGTVLQLREGVVEELCVDCLFDLVHFFHDGVPLRGEYLRS